MAVGLRKSWLFPAAVLVLIGALLVWVWSDSGMRPLRPQSEPASLPQVGQ